MDIKSGNPYPAGALSNFARHSFVLDEVDCASLEGWIQSLKFKNPDMQAEICTMAGSAAKRAGANKNWTRDQTLYWRGVAIKRDSKEYQTLLDRAYETCFTTNDKAKKALLATGHANLTHSIGRTKMSETVLTKREFCYRLMAIRKRLQTDEMVEF